MRSYANITALYGTCSISNIRENTENWNIQLAANILSELNTILQFTYHTPIDSKTTNK